MGIRQYDCRKLSLHRQFVRKVYGASFGQRDPTPCRKTILPDGRRRERGTVAKTDGDFALTIESDGEAITTKR